MSTPSARVKRAQQVRQQHRMGMTKVADLDETTVTVSATTTVIAIFFLLSLGATVVTLYVFNRCINQDASALHNMGWAPDGQTMRVGQNH